MDVFASQAAVTPATNAGNDFLKALAAANAGATPADPTTAAAGKKDRKPSEFWLNVGIEIPSPDGDGTVFVSLPGGGIALDDLKAIDVRGNNAAWIDLQQAKNQLLAAVQGGAAALTPGERKRAPKLVVEIARVAPANSAPVAEGGLASAVKQIFG